MQKMQDSSILESLSKQLEYACRHSRGYREKYSAAGFKPADLKSMEDIGRIPFLRREEIQENWRDFSCLPQAEWRDICTTGGTTGNILYIPFSEGDYRITAPLMAESLRRIGITSGDTVQIMVPLENLRPAATGMQSILLDEVGAAVIRAGPAAVEVQIKYILELHPTVLMGTPSFLLHLGRTLFKKGFRNGRDFHVRMGICPGQPTNGLEWKPLAIRSRLEEVWQMEVYSLYGSTEMNNGMLECPQHRGHHSYPGLFYFEIIEPDGDRILKPGEIGELVLTTLNREALPFIRYRTGDVTWLDHTPCPCGTPGVRVMSILGHCNEKFKVKGTILYPQQIEEILFSIPGVAAAVIEVHLDERGIDLLHLKVAADADQGEEFPGRIRKKVKEFAGVTPVVSILPEKEIRAIWFSKGTSKPKKFWDMRSKPV